MDRRKLKVGLILSLSFLSFGEKNSDWKAASKGDQAIQFRWSRPASNTCDVSFMDLQLNTKTSLTATIQYLPHRSAKGSSESSTVELVIGGSGSASEHISSCEQVVTVTVSGISRE